MDEKAKGNCILWPISVRDVKKAQRQHIKTKDISKLKILMQFFLEDKKTTVPQEYQDHPLQGSYKITEIRISNRISFLFTN